MAAAQNDGSGEPPDVDEKSLGPTPLNVGTKVITGPDGRPIRVIDISGTYTDATSTGIGNLAAKDINAMWSGSFTDGNGIQYRLTTNFTAQTDIFQPAEVTFTLGGCSGHVACVSGFNNVININPSQIFQLRASTAAHEFGHVLGFHHFYNSTGNIMSYAEQRAVQLQNAQLLWQKYGP